MGLKLKDIISHIYPVGKYFKTKYDKKQIVLHHTVSGPGVKGDINYWIKSKFRIGTCVIIGRRGDINQIFSSSYWTYHLGVKGSVYKKLGLPYKRWDMNSIGIEIDSYGGLKLDMSTGKYKTVYGNVIPSENVIYYPDGYRGFHYFEKYTSEQINAVKDLLVYWSKRYGISLQYNEQMWDVSKQALSGNGGVWSHTSFRFDKSDCHPQPELIEMLKSL